MMPEHHPRAKPFLLVGKAALPGFLNCAAAEDKGNNSPSSRPMLQHNNIFINIPYLGKMFRNLLLPTLSEGRNAWLTAP